MDKSIFQLRGVWFLSFLFNFMTTYILCNGNSVGPDQTPRYAASDLGLHCLSFPGF